LRPHDGAAGRFLLRPPAVPVLAAATLLVLAVPAALVFRGWTRPPRQDPAAESHWPAVIRGRSLLQQGRPDLALLAVAHVRDERPGAGESMGVAGVALARLGDVRNARHALERALKLQPRQPLPVKTLAAVYLSLGETDRGLACLETAAQLAPKDPRPWTAMGMTYLDMGRPADAARVFAEALHREPSLADARLGRIEALLDTGRAEEAATLVSDALSRDPDSPRVLGLAARQARDSGSPATALTLAGRALQGDPDLVNALLTRARVLHATGKDQAALRDLDRAVAANPNLLAGWTLKLQVESRLGLDGPAAETARHLRAARERLARMEQLTEQVRTQTDDPEPRWRLGRVAAEGGQVRLAANCYRSALALDPNCGPARDGLAGLGPNGQALAESPGSP
jgi:tetratricopeptide (TPR) repeat protein